MKNLAAFLTGLLFCLTFSTISAAQNPFDPDPAAPFDAKSTCNAMTYGHVLAECSTSCGEKDRGCIHVCCHNGCNQKCKMGVPDYWDCHRQCEEWRDPGTPDMFSRPQPQ